MSDNETPPLFNSDNRILITGHHTLGYLYGCSGELAVIEHSPKRFCVLPVGETQLATREEMIGHVRLDLLLAVNRAKWLGATPAEINQIVQQLLG